MQGVSVVRDDGTRGTVVAEESTGKVLVEFKDGSRLAVPTDSLVPQTDGSYRLSVGSAHLTGAASSEEVVIPVVAEELTVETYKVARAKVRVHKRVETREEVVDTPVIQEEVVVEHIPINKIIKDGDNVPTAREEAGVLIIPIIEEVLVVQKQLVVREEVRMSKRRKTTSTPQTVVLRREVVDVHREDLPGVELPEVEGQSIPDKNVNLKK
jgi:uncharacterized protein (TIGR02271 family)